MQQKCSFTTQVQYYALRKLDSTTMVGFEAKRARKITMDGIEQDFKSFVKTGYPSASRVSNCKYTYIPCFHKLATFNNKTKKVYMQDPEKGTSTYIQFEKEICALCQGPAGTVFVVCRGELVQMSCEGRTLNKCSYTGYASRVCANKDSSVIALSNLSTITLYKLSIE
ncbi:hypothetical protein DPMN_132458 [Dreissena polymorpha]|uniref:Uncharacterized protein n=1 Tax=Dreissena polymorpha TaxID=45954 RepID=A0A9D4FW57_DREPO|nr:hypothetical protein DPMN_132458 [Dreissena polymorpha]